MRFEELSLDCSSVIWKFIDNHDLIALYLSGNRQIMAKIANGTTNLACDLVLHRKVVFPKLVTSFTHLTDLRVSLPKPELYTSIPGFEWSLIPSSLIRLDVPITWAQFLAPPSPLPPLPSLRTLRLQINGKWNDYGCIPVFASWTPHLLSLHVHGSPNREDASEPFFTGTLPSTLTEVDLQAIPLEIYSPGYWPPSLTRLDLQLTATQPGTNTNTTASASASATATATATATNISTWFHDLPASLTSFNISNHISSFCEAIDWSLPHLPNLQHLGLVMCKKMLQSASEIALLPRNLKSLAIFIGECMISPDSIDRFRALPPSLTFLEVPAGICLPPTAAAYASLPRTLRQLKVHNPQHSKPFCTPDIHPFLPPEVSFHFVTTQCDPILTSYLHLTDLHLIGAASFKNLPPNLKRLDAAGVVLNSSFLALLPTGLEKIRIHSLRIDDKQLLLLPRGLKVLEASHPARAPPPFSSGSSLPRTLQVLSIYGMAIGNVSQWFSGLPTTITVLRTGSLKIPNGTEAQDFAALSRLSSLSELSLGFSVTPLYRGYSSILKFLPPYLTKLYLPASFGDDLDSGISDEDIALLPRGLCELKLPRSSKVTKSCEKFLPPHLSQVVIDGQIQNWSSPERPNAGFEPP